MIPPYVPEELAPYILIPCTVHLGPTFEAAKDFTDVPEANSPYLARQPLRDLCANENIPKGSPILEMPVSAGITHERPEPEDWRFRKTASRR